MSVVLFRTKLSPNQYYMLAHANEVRMADTRHKTDNQGIKYLRRQVAHRLITACKYV